MSINKVAAMNQIYAMRTMLDAMEQEIMKEPNPQKECEHRNINNLTTMGGPDEWKCKDCGLHYKEGTDQS